MTSEISGFFYDATSAKYDPLTWQRPYRGIIGNGIVKNPPSDLGVNTGAVTGPRIAEHVGERRYHAGMDAGILVPESGSHQSHDHGGESISPAYQPLVITLFMTRTAPIIRGSITVSVITGTPAAARSRHP